MADPRRIRALQLIQRVKQHAIDEQAAQMQAIRAEQGAISREMDNLQKRQDEEAHIASPEAGPYLAGFLRAIAQRRGFLEGQLQELDQKAESMEEALRERFLDAKRNQSVLDGTLAEKRAEDARVELQNLEEVARNRYMRARKEG